VKEKNIKRAAHALYQSQADDKNELLTSCISGNPDAVKLVKDQGRALVVLEKLVLPQGKADYSEAEMEAILLKKLRKKGHRIQGDEEEDTPEYAAEKSAALEARTSRVPDLFGKKLSDLPEEEKTTCSSTASLEEVTQELIDKTIAQQQAKLTTYSVLDAQKLPIPAELEAEVKGFDWNVLDLRDENNEKDFLAALREYGIPVTSSSQKSGWLALAMASVLALSLVSRLKN
jgi:hypothetical protein